MLLYDLNSETCEALNIHVIVRYKLVEDMKKILEATI